MSQQKKTPLHARHVSCGARMVEFAGYSMPVQFPDGVLAEHLHTRRAAGLFDVSHMGQIVVRPRSGKVEDAAAALEELVPMNFIGLGEGRQRYALFTNDEGGILDDLMVANRGDHLLVVANAACKDADLRHLEDSIGDRCEVEMLDRGLVALQGPKAEEVLAEIAPDVAGMRFMDYRTVDIRGYRCWVSRAGYTGEDGFEISVPAEQLVDLAEMLEANEAVKPIGLGARDSLRLEAGLCLYGQDIDETTTPVEAALEWSIQPARRRGGARAGGFPGAERILEQMETGAERRRVGLAPEGKAPMRAGTELYADGDEAVGRVTSGSFGPSVEAPVAMGYVPIGLAAPETGLHGLLRGRKHPVRVAKLPFIEPGYKRG
jgi:aminomethyltransferase